MANVEQFTLMPEQREKLLLCRAAWEEGEDEEHLERLRQREEDTETLRALARLLEETGFAAGQDLNYSQTARLLLLVRALAPNPNLDARLLKRAGEPQEFNRDLRDLLYGKASLPYRLRSFLTRRHAGAQTVLQLLCAAFPHEWPLVTQIGLQALELSPFQIQAARATARETYGLPAPEDRAEAEGTVPDNDRVLRLLAEVIVYRAVYEVLDAGDYLQIHRLLSQELPRSSQNRRRRFAALHGRASSPNSLLSSAVRERAEGEYNAGGNEGGDQNAEPPAGVLAESPDIANLSALRLLAELEQEIAAQGFTYPPLTIRDYYISLQTKPFVLLSGLSGTGKTRLSALFAEALTGGALPQYRLLPVRPDWADSTSLLGYVNLLAPSEDGRGRFVTTPFLDFLLRAARPENAYRAFFLCLDELNLARVEHYFAEILSAMETASREILLANGRSVRLPGNLFLTGTLNSEEGTHALSRKVLDRANTLHFYDVCLSEESEGQDRAEKRPPTGGESILPVLRQAFFLQTRVASVAEARAKLRRVGKETDLGAQVVGLLAEANALLEPSGLHFAYRVRDEILRYVANSFGPEGESLLMAESPEDSNANLLVALDLQILQKVLPRLNGIREQVETPLQDLLHWSEKRHLTQTTRKLTRMLVRLEQNGFVSFDF